MHKRSPQFIPAVIHNKRYVAAQMQQSVLDLDKVPAELQEGFREATKRQIAKLAKKLPLPDYRGYPVATPHGFRRFV